MTARSLSPPNSYMLLMTIWPAISAPGVTGTTQGLSIEDVNVFNSDPRGSGAPSGSRSSIKFEDIDKFGFTIGRFSGRNKRDPTVVRDVCQDIHEKKPKNEWRGQLDASLVTRRVKMRTSFGHVQLASTPARRIPTQDLLAVKTTSPSNPSTSTYRHTLTPSETVRSSIMHSFRFIITAILILMTATALIAGTDSIILTEMKD